MDQFFNDLTGKGDNGEIDGRGPWNEGEPWEFVVILFGERSLRRALIEYVEHFHAERNYQGKGNVLLFPRVRTSAAKGLFNAASDWVDFCVITIRRQRERGKRLR